MRYTITLLTKDFKYQIEPDTVCDITTTTKMTYKRARVIGLDKVGSCLRLVTVDDGITSIPLNLIQTIKETIPDEHYKRIIVMKR